VLKVHKGMGKKPEVDALVNSKSILNGESMFCQVAVEKGVA
jgi:hypothetical protein